MKCTCTNPSAMVVAVSTIQVLAVFDMVGSSPVRTDSYRCGLKRWLAATLRGVTPFIKRCVRAFQINRTVNARF
ncbi:hypothetical protein BKA63DRAFT_500655 [Paraphoma chrysanthemicola]|nr:hypothetical protein BKA63DRAFT_500655 [Paraphoma chrysanthemicola]